MSLLQMSTLDKKGLHSRLYERPNPNGVGRQVVKESLPSAELKNPQIFADQSAITIRNEYHAIEYVRQHTTIPVPNILEYRDAPGLPVRIVMEYVENALPPQYIERSKDRDRRIKEQLRDLTTQLHSITDKSCRSFAGPPLFALRMEETLIPLQNFTYKRYDNDSPYVLCHGDIAWHNLLIDPDTYEIKCVLDWEYAGFYPVEVESTYWMRPGPIYGTLGLEHCDIDDVLAVIYSHLEVATDEDVKLNSPDMGSKVRQLLLNAHLPTGITASVATVFCQGVDTARKRLAASIRDVGQNLASDNAIVHTVVNQLHDHDGNLTLNKLSSMYEDHAKIAQISKQLPGAFATLADKLESTGAPYLPLRDHLSVELDAWAPVFEKEKLKSLPDTEGWHEESALRTKAREMLVERRNIVDEAYQIAEVQKWTAIKEFAEHLLRLSTAAELVIPYLATHDQDYPSPNLDPERAWAEYQAIQVASLKGAETEDGAVQGNKEDFIAKWGARAEDRAKDIEVTADRRLRKEKRLQGEDRLRLMMRTTLRSKLAQEEHIKKRRENFVPRPITVKTKKIRKDDQ